ncbi:hypothetical protein MOO46_05495 [Apilactobacillus apisilvae]|uniref:Uncharacterized protein n=1 Tax=Apilactobacillus apisilvae TaxID=2923364 RepID=A0ABY4PJF6_9LACO|nr:hypothetical protein [Apilactobacillus apisilvae]UQS85748.1 hypothetical protein MOO46_05495 [Apilactobacillus apisilvae]
MFILALLTYINNKHK